MSDELAPQEPNTGEEPQPDAAAPLTRDDVAAMLIEQRDSIFGMHRKMFGDHSKKIDAKIDAIGTPHNPQPDPKPQPDPQPHDDELRARMDAYDRDRDFDSAVQGLYLRGEKRDRFRSMFQADKPDDSAAWAKDQAKVWGIGTETTQTPQEPSRPGAAPAAQRNGVTPTRLIEWSEEDADADFKAKAPNPADKYSIENKSYYKALHKRALEEWADIRFDLVGRK